MGTTSSTAMQDVCSVCFITYSVSCIAHSSVQMVCCTEHCFMCTVHSALLHVHLNDRRVHLAAGRRAHPLKCALSTSFAFYSTPTTIICCSPLCTLLFLSASHSSLQMLLKLCRSTIYLSMFLPKNGSHGRAK